MNQEEQIAFISSVVSAEFYRPVMVATRLPTPETHALIASVALEVYEKIKDRHTLIEFLEADAKMTGQIILFENHNIKL
jgi:hypothetical protein